MAEKDVTPLDPTKPPKFEDFTVATYGSGTLAEVTQRGFFKSKNVVSKLFTDVDEVVDFDPKMFFYAERLKLKKNGMQDETEILNVLQKVLANTGCLFVIRSTITIETAERMIQSVGLEAFNMRVVYWPSLEDEDDVIGVVNQEVNLVGGEPQAKSSLMQFVNQAGQFAGVDATTVIGKDIFSSIYTKLAITSYRVLREKFFEQLHEAVLDLGGANPHWVRETVRLSGVVTENRGLFPRYMFGNEARNDEVKTFVGNTEAFPLLDAIIKD